MNTEKNNFIKACFAEKINTNHLHSSLNEILVRYG